MGYKYQVNQAVKVVSGKYEGAVGEVLDCGENESGAVYDLRIVGIVKGDEVDGVFTFAESDLEGV